MGVPFNARHRGHPVRTLAYAALARTARQTGAGRPSGPAGKGRCPSPLAAAGRRSAGPGR